MRKLITKSTQKTVKMKNRDSKAVAQLPVSRKFYKSLEARVAEIVEAIRGYRDDEWIEFVMSMINDYLLGAEKAFYVSGRASVECEVICLTLKAEIDKAVERSRRARERGAMRRNSKPSETKPMQRNETAVENTTGDCKPMDKPVRTLRDAYKETLDTYARIDARLRASRYHL